MPQVSSKDSNNPMQDNNKIEDDIIVDSFEEVTDVENLERSVSKNTPAAENFNVDNVLGTNAGWSKKINYMVRMLHVMIDTVKSIEENIDILIDSLGKDADNKENRRKKKYFQKKLKDKTSF